MKIKSIRIQNFRSFQDETIALNPHSCFVGPNGAGKSSVLSALNVFFREQTDSTTDMAKLTDEDYFLKNTAEPVRITVTFDDLSEQAQQELVAYVRQGELVVAAEAVFDPETRVGNVHYFGQRLGLDAFRAFFEQEKTGALAPELKDVYSALREQFPDLPAAGSKAANIAALHSFESEHTELCVLIRSEDNFYGVNSTGKLAQFVQWVFVPAVKNAGEEAQEAKNTALGKLIARAVRSRTNFATELETLKTETLERYQGLLRDNEASLKELSDSLQRRLEDWAHPDVRLGIEWQFDSAKSVVLQPPLAGIKTGEGDFLGSLARMGHGLQRSYLLALLQELADSEADDAPTLILGCEEPELYQHPPQARHLAEVLRELATGNNQILVTTHSPLFVSGDGFENVRLVRRSGANGSTEVRSLTFSGLCECIRDATGKDPEKPTEGLVAKIHQALQPGIAEMFFTKVAVLVEGLEDVAYITTELHLADLWTEFRRLGCHIIPVNGKDRLIQPLAIAVVTEMPVFVVFDADSDTEREDHREKHERDNRALQTLLGVNPDPFPAADVFGPNYVIWRTSLTQVVKEDFGDAYDRLTEAARQHYAQEGGLEKNELFIADWISAARDEGLSSPASTRLCEAIIEFAKTK
jgi:energy-coupling factor transporter ATP-binding protein EcfA2